MAKYDKADRPEMSTDDMYEVARMMCDRTFNDPSVAPKLQASKLIIQFVYFDEERWGDEKPLVTVDCTQDPIGVVLGPTDLKPNIVMTMEAFTAHLFWMEKLNMMAAITRGQIKVKGPLPKAMRLLPALKPAYVYYRQVLAELGRDDLLAFPPD